MQLVRFGTEAYVEEYSLLGLLAISIKYDNVKPYLISQLSELKTTMLASWDSRARCEKNLTVT